MSLIIEVEGITGVGKTTMVPYFVKYFRDKGFSCSSYKEPGTTTLGNIVRDALFKNEGIVADEDYLTQMLLFLANRSDIYYNILSNSKDDIIIFDRYVGSTYVYQLKMGNEKARQVLSTVMGLISYTSNRFVDLTILLHCDVNTAYKRVVERENQNPRNEKLQDKDLFLKFNRRAGCNFMSYFQENNGAGLYIDTDMSVSSVLDEFKENIGRVLDFDTLSPIKH